MTKTAAKPAPPPASGWRLKASIVSGIVFGETGLLLRKKVGGEYQQPVALPAWIKIVSRAEFRSDTVTGGFKDRISRVYKLTLWLKVCLLEACFRLTIYGLVCNQRQTVGAVDGCGSFASTR